MSIKSIVENEVMHKSLKEPNDYHKIESETESNVVNSL